MRRLAFVVVAALCALAPAIDAQPATQTAADANPPGYDFTPVAKALVAVASCGGGAIPEGFPTERIEQHCAAIKQTQNAYAESWVKIAKPWFAEHVPNNIPKKVVYPFAGADLSTALTVYPDADEITTLSLEPAGDPRTLDVLRQNPGRVKAAKVTKTKPEKPKMSGENYDPEIDTIGTTPAIIQGKQGLDRALAVIQYELHFLYHVNFSNTLNMIDAMRGGQLPTQLVFGLSALQVHGYEVVSLRYFKLSKTGEIEYLTDADIKKAPDPLKGKASTNNRIFANAELRFKKPGGRVQIYRHIQVNLDDDHLKEDPRVIKHLELKGDISAMTKAASYLLSWTQFQTIRNYLLGHVQWMVSDATGIAPRWGTPAGFTYETYGEFAKAHIGAGNGIAPEWKAEWEKEPKRPLAFRFGYYDGTKAHSNHLVIMKKATK
ncbi:MAG TPA: hypothetical protein VGM90_10535 [Kofleriaceae bacterium]|jgi:hypothetical protein